MPTYIYQCDQDPDHDSFTKIHSMTKIGTPEEPVFPCPQCQGATHRIPQIPMAIGREPVRVLHEWTKQKRDESYKRRMAHRRAQQQAAIIQQRKQAAKRKRHQQLKEQ